MPSRLSFKAFAAAAILAAAFSAAAAPSQAKGPILLRVHVTGYGKVTSPDISIDCGMGAKACSTKVSLLFKAPIKVEPGPGGKFLGWTGQCFKQGTDCLVVFDGENNPIDVYAKFSDGAGAAPNNVRRCPPYCPKRQPLIPKINERNIKVRPEE